MTDKCHGDILVALFKLRTNKPDKLGLPWQRVHWTCTFKRDTHYYKWSLTSSTKNYSHIYLVMTNDAVIIISITNAIPAQ